MSLDGEPLLLEVVCEALVGLLLSVGQFRVVPYVQRELLQSRLMVGDLLDNRLLELQDWSAIATWISGREILTLEASISVLLTFVLS